MLAALLDGTVISPQQSAIHIDDRGLLYGDGVFETMSLQNGKLRFLNDHLRRMQHGCKRLGIVMPDTELLINELQQLTHNADRGIVKLIITRGRGGRGYRASQCVATRLMQLFEPVELVTGLTVRWCATRLARNEALAGIKHLNRLEQVLAQSEWDDATINEGLMLDTEGELISGTMSNVFMVVDDVLVTPDLRFSGVQGVMRGNILHTAVELSITVEQRAVHPEELLSATEVFMTNAVRGIQPVVALLPSSIAGRQWDIGALTMKLMDNLAQEH
jgi:4-amino-4-deoxychorismate lyase